MRQVRSSVFPLLIVLSAGVVVSDVALFVVAIGQLQQGPSRAGYDLLECAVRLAIAATAGVGAASTVAA